ncbi:MAG: EAL domain-containing protein [Betaproteobacteria bacterium]|nr:EAL domain-containing protein [Betaproteobacteria bacterium]
MKAVTHPGGDRLSLLVDRLALTVAGLILVTLPLGYFTLAYRNHAQLVETEAYVKAGVVTMLASRAPEMWMFQTYRMEELLARRMVALDGEEAQVRDSAGRVLVSVGNPPLAPVLSRSHAVYESGQVVGRVTILHSFRDDLIGAALAGLLGFLLGGAAYGTLRVLPLRALRRLTVELSGQHMRYVTAVESSMDGYALLDAGGRLLDVNAALSVLTGYSRDELLHMSIADIEAPGAGAGFLGRGASTHSGRRETRWKRSGGSLVDVEVTATYLAQDGGEYFCFVRDITERKQSEALIWRQANFDTLTGLPNRSMFHDRMAQEIKKAHRTGHQLALLFIDLDRFKEVNDTLGHDMGDLLLTEAARRIGACLRETDTVARLGGDEFTVLLTELDDAGSVERVVGNILKTLAEPFHLGGDVGNVSASIGITLYPGDADDRDELLKNADLAMYVAKNQGRNRYSYYTPALQEAAQTHLRQANDLRGAIADEQFLVYFQPIVELASSRIHKTEALIRWQHPRRGLVGPAEFIPLAEETGLLAEIGDWMVREAARWQQRWSALQPEATRAGIDPSPAQMRAFGTPGIVVQINESLLTNTSPDLAEALLKYHAAGIQVAVDNFGTGSSSMATLKKFNIDYLKIDRACVGNLMTDPSERLFAEAVVAMAHKLGLKVIAEGVETQAQRDVLLAAGCDYAQGNLFSKPLPPEEFEALLKSCLEYSRIDA